MAKTKNVLLRLDPELAALLQAVADVEERPVSEVAREAIRSLIEARRADASFQRRLAASAARQATTLRKLEAEEDG